MKDTKIPISTDYEGEVEEFDEDDYEDLPDHVSQLTEEETKTFAKIEECQEKIEEINFNYEKEIELLNQKYGKIKKPVLDEMQQLVEGKKDNLPKIPSFWFHVIENSGLFDQLEGGEISITKDDEDSLSYLKQVVCHEEFTETHQTFTLEFHFDENPYFTNSKLTKVFKKKYYKDYKSMIQDTHHHHDGEECDHDHSEEEQEKPQGTKIEWKEGKNLQVKLVTKTLKGNKKKNKTEKKIQKLEAVESFYNFFNNFDDDQINEEHWELLNELRSDVLQDPFYYYMDSGYDEDDDIDEEYSDEGDEE